MPERVLIELDGSSPRFRISRPGKSVFSTNVGDFLIREDMPVYRAFVNGSRSFSSGTSSTNVTIPSISGPVFVVARASDGLAMGQQAQFGGYYVAMVNNTTLNIRNEGAARTIFYSVFGNQLLGGA